MKYPSRFLARSLMSAGVAALGTFLTPAQAQAVLLFGLDAKGESSAGAGDATFNVYDGLGVSVLSPTLLSNWLTATATPAPATSLIPTFNTANANVTVVANPTGIYAITLTLKLDLTGTHDVTFDKFAIGFQRGGTVTSNVVGDAGYSTDGINFTPTLIQEVAVGLNNGSDNVGPADTITDLRAPDGLGGTIGPQQVYVMSGLGGAGTLNSGSFHVRLTVGESSNNQTTLTLLNDRYDLTTSAMALSAANVTDLGADDGYDIAWFGAAVPVPEPGALALGVFGLAGLLARRCRR